MQNSNLSITKDKYFEMCEMLGTEPIDSEIPIELEDFPVEVQQAMLVYRMLRDEWDSIGGSYLGKTLIGINEVLEATEVEPEDRKFAIRLVRIIDSVRAKHINSKLATKTPATP